MRRAVSGAPLELDDASHVAAEHTTEALRRTARAVRQRRSALNATWPGVLARLDAFVGQALAANPDRPVHCKEGCATCCHQWLLDVHPHEIERLGARVQAAGRTEEVQVALRRRLEAYAPLREAASGEDPERSAALDYLARGLPCVFLDRHDGCSVYADRPWVCRTYFSLAPADRCAASALRAGRGRTFVLDPGDGADGALQRIGAPFAAPGATGALVPDLLAWLERSVRRTEPRVSTDVRPRDEGALGAGAAPKSP